MIIKFLPVRDTDIVGECFVPCSKEELDEHIETLKTDGNEVTAETLGVLPKPKGKRGGGKNSPVIGDNGFLTKPGDNSAVVSKLLELYKMTPVKTDEETEERICWFFQWCIDRDFRPTVTAMALSLGIDRRTLLTWENGTALIGSSRMVIIKKAKAILNAYLEELGMNGKINPVTMIVLLKNHFGYTDKSEIILTPNNPLGNMIDPQEIQQKYIENLPEDVE